MSAIFTFLLFVLATNAWAGQISLLDQAAPIKEVAPQEKKAIVKISKVDRQENTDVSFEEMKEFMRQENERLKTIKILNLDLERVDLELKKRQIELKLADLNKNTAMTVPSGLLNSSKLVYKLAGIFVRENSRQALINANGVNMQIEEGKPIDPGVRLKRVNTDTALLEYTDGKQETINLGS